MALDLQYTLVNDTPADASPPEANFNRIEQYINQETIQRNGTVAMTAQLKLLGDPVEALDAAPKQYVDTFVPVGSILMFGGDIAPIGGKWALCNGADLEAAAYPVLYALFGTKYGGSAGHFNLPNLAGKFPLGVSGADLMGASGGTRDSAVVNHTHSVDHAHAAFTTGTDSPDHAHSDDHMHTGTTAGMDRAATHHHTNPAIEGTAGSAFGASLIWDQTTPPGGHVALNSGETNTDHLHAFSTNYKSQQGFGATVGGANARHAHAAIVPAYTGASGAASGGVAGTNGNMPPYVVVNYIVRIA